MSITRGERSFTVGSSVSSRSHLVGCLLRYAHARQVGHVLAQIMVTKAANQMVEQRERQK